MPGDLFPRCRDKILGPGVASISKQTKMLAQQTNNKQRRADGHDTRSLAHYLGHRNLQSTARYTALAPDRFAKFWQD